MNEQTNVEMLYEEALSLFPEDVKRAFLSLRDHEYLDTFELTCLQDGRLFITLEDYTSISRKLILTLKEGATPLFDKVDFFDFSEAYLTRGEESYKLFFALYKEDSDVPYSTEIEFTEAQVEINVYRVELDSITDSPWDGLELMATMILSKEELGDAYFNPRERELIPLLKELCAITYSFTFYGNEQVSPCILRGYAEKHGHRKLLPLIDAAEKEHRAQKWGGNRHRARLNATLNKSAYEGMWRDIYERISESQEGYPTKVGSYTKRDVGRLRRRITKKFAELGYEGEYPVFRKRGRLKGLRVATSYNMSYFISNERNVEFIVKCSEDVSCDLLTVHLLSATAILKKGESVRDAYSCCFNSNGRRLFKELFVHEEQLPKIESYVTIAAKRAECEGLSREEKGLLNEFSWPWLYYVIMFLVTGGLFATVMTIGLGLVFTLMIGILDGFASVLETLRDAPWLLIFAFSFIGFGGAMTLIEALAKRK